MKNSIRQMLRQPLRTIGFLVLLTFAALLMTLGARLWERNERTAAEYEDQFVTVGTVSQKSDSYEQTLTWDAEKKDYLIRKNGQYTSYLTADELLIPEVEYLAEPEQRAYYGSWAEEYETVWRNETLYGAGDIIEFSPLEDCMPNDSVEIKFTKVIGGDTRQEGTVVFFCDHFNPQPEMLYKDKTYVAMLSTWLWPHGGQYNKIVAENPMKMRLEYVPNSIASYLFRPDGSKVEDEFEGGQEIFEVTEDFYDTPAGKRLLALAETTGYLRYTMPVTGTNKTCLLTPFYNEDSYICQGRDIGEEEYASGSKVCLAPKDFMERNGLSLGDKIKTHLFYTNTRVNAGVNFSEDGGAVFQIIDENGKMLEPFENSEYTVVGIYDTRKGQSNPELLSGVDELIVPLKSIESGMTQNLIRSGPMTDSTTSFQIPNGTIEDFQKAWAKYGSPELEITFHDMGYSQLKAGIESMRNLSLFFLIVGVILTGLLLFFFSHLFITKQARRTAIERSLGMSPGQCRKSLLSGLLLLVVLGSAVGSATGAVISRNISLGQAGQVYYDSTYSVGSQNAGREITVKEAGDEGLGWISLYCAATVILAGVGIAVLKINQNLKKEPMELLGQMQKE